MLQSHRLDTFQNMVDLVVGRVTLEDQNHVFVAFFETLDACFCDQSDSEDLQQTNTAADDRVSRSEGSSAI